MKRKAASISSNHDSFLNPPPSFLTTTQHHHTNKANKLKALNSLPNELLYLMMTFLPIKLNVKLSLTCHELQEVYIIHYLPRLKKYVLKDQQGEGGGRSLIHILKDSKTLEAIVLDLRTRGGGGGGGGGGNNNNNETSDGNGGGDNRPGFSNNVAVIQDCHLAALQEHERSLLHSIIIRGCTSITPYGFYLISQSCHCLTALDLSYNPNLSPTPLMKILDSNPSLAYLSLERSYNAVTDEVLYILGKYCRYLKTLSISYCNLISDYGIICLADGCKLLTELSIAHCYDVTALAICRLLSSCRYLFVLSLEWCFNTDDSVLEVMRTQAQQVAVLGIEHCNKVTDLSMANCIQSLNMLNFLSLDSCVLIGPATVTAISSSLSNIFDVYLNCCPLITDEEVKLLAKACTKIRSLGIEECNISDEGIFQIANYSADIKVLGLNGNPKVSDLSIADLIQKRNGIEKLYISYTAATNASVISIALFSTNMKSLSLVGCKVDSGGLLELGKPHHPCHSTLRDLHVSRNLRYAKQFFSPDMNLRYSCAGNKIKTSGCEARKGKARVADEANEYSILDDEIPEDIDFCFYFFPFKSPHLELVINLGKTIFAHTLKPCVVYLR